MSAGGRKPSFLGRSLNPSGMSRFLERLINLHRNREQGAANDLLNRKSRTSEA